MWVKKKLLSGSATLPVNFVCGAAYADAGMSFVLPKKGKYLLVGRIYTYQSSGQSGDFKLRNVTDGLDVTTDIRGGYAVGIDSMFGIPVQANVETAGDNKEIRLQGKNAFGTMTLMGISGGVTSEVIWRQQE
jgi:hypothetical protein